VHRTLKFINTQFQSEIPKTEALGEEEKQILSTLKEKVAETAEEIEDCKLQSALNEVIGMARMGNQYLNEKEPWNLIKKDKTKTANVIYVAAQIVKALAITSAPFIPNAAEELWNTLNLPGSVHEQTWNEALTTLPANHKISEAKPLFKKIDATEKELDEMLEKMGEKLSREA
jgi:methionyl-tRNA synthetase